MSRMSRVSSRPV
ncbi:hypothetical protein E2C01_011283 [Portunus trituberculatus]|uniref:Uncharacterized protein n=1 Tax=Portunus trituberculatus TaxID=210409 RepID=A0A5B7DAN3_PORTR|nr:hypothetical protein [Portunus trituberculatus]